MPELKRIDVILEDGSYFTCATRISKDFVRTFIAGFFCGNRDIGDFTDVNDVNFIDHIDEDNRLITRVSCDGDYIDFIIREAD